VTRRVSISLYSWKDLNQSTNSLLIIKIGDGTDFPSESRMSSPCRAKIVLSSSRSESVRGLLPIEI
jgi:hypothetical protein